MNLEKIEKIIKKISPEAKGKVGIDGRFWVKIPVDKIRDLLRELKNNGYHHISTISAIDLLEKFELIYHLLPDNREDPYLNIRTEISRENPHITSITDIYPAANIYEREVFDLFGIIFNGHPNLKRLLLPEDVPEGFYPLRKDFKIENFEKREVKK